MCMRVHQVTFGHAESYLNAQSIFLVDSSLRSSLAAKQ